uniref:Peptidase S1 domain-containing protein n=1 Tax=Romanomermis culicivorax TaxID=13658 RepID=A0A915KIC1_ROMCU
MKESRGSRLVSAPTLCQARTALISAKENHRKKAYFGTRQIYSSVSAHHDWIDTKLKPIPTPKSSVTNITKPFWTAELYVNGQPSHCIVSPIALPHLQVPGATQTSTDYVLTSAACLINYDEKTAQTRLIDGHNLTIVLVKLDGKKQISNPVFIKIRKFFVHEKFDADELNDTSVHNPDIAVIRTEVMIDVMEPYTVVNQPLKGVNKCQVLAWEIPAGNSSGRHAVNIDINSKIKTNGAYLYNSIRHNSKTSLESDPGTAFICNTNGRTVLHGIVSHVSQRRIRQQFETKFVYSSIAKNYDWIVAKLKQN